jgi:hypothetical protein
MIILEPTFGKVFCATFNNYYASLKLVQFLVGPRTNTYGTVNINRSYMPLQVRNMKLNTRKCATYQRGKMPEDNSLLGKSTM